MTKMATEKIATCANGEISTYTYDADGNLLSKTGTSFLLRTVMMYITV